MARIVFISTFPPEPLMSGFAMRIFGILDSIPDGFELLKIYPEGMQDGKFPPDVTFAPGAVSRMREFFSLTPRTLLKYNDSPDRSRIIKAVEQFNPDLVIVSGIHVFPFVPSGARVLYDSHNIEWHLGMLLYKHQRASVLVKIHRHITYMKLRRRELQLVRSAEGVVACSKTDADYFSSVREEHVAFVPNGVDTDYWDIPREPQPGVILFSGDMSYFPNINSVHFITQEILPLLKSYGWTGKLIVCGKNPSQSIRSLESDSVMITGTVDDLRKYYSRAEVFIAPMRIGSGTPLKVITAMAAGVPVVTTSRIAESLGILDTGIVLQADQLEEAARSLLKVMNDRALADQCSRAGKSLACEKFSWSVAGGSFWKQVKKFIR
ncbi:MAG: glycosyltransferase family 4 protein [Candidatus Fermentibacteraceae bacterium]|nr:glycosyltransferase family 4 protein [Candidatus Fermentibacteraceae bacterium]